MIVALIIAVLVMFGMLIWADMAFGLFPQGTYKAIGLLIALGGAAWTWYKYGDNVKIGEEDNEIPATEAFETVQEYLKNQPGKYKIDESDNDKLHEGTLKVDQNGEVNRYYSIIGPEFRTDDNKPNTIRIIWNLTENDLEHYDGWVPGKYRTQPFYNKDRWLKVEGYKTKSDDDDSNQQVVNVNSGMRGDNNV